jgi:hypothetical protein
MSPVGPKEVTPMTGEEPNLPDEGDQKAKQDQQERERREQEERQRQQESAQ